MPDQKIPEQEPGRKHSFIREKVVRPPMSRGQIVRRVAVYLLIAVMAGAAAGAGFAVARPLAERYLAPEETEESIPITLPIEEPETQPQPTEPEDTQEPSEPTEAVKDILKDAMEDYEYSVDDVNAMFSSLRSVVQEADRSIVVVHSVKQETDWFDNPVETSGLYAGAVIASTPHDFLIFTPDHAVEDADSIKVTFSDGTEADGTVRQSDQAAGMAVVAVDKSLLSDTARNNTQALTLGNAYGIRQGDLVIALGAPSGIVHSSAYGFVSYILRVAQVPDGVARVLYTDIGSSAQAGTFLFNLSGELVGWVTEAFQSESGGCSVPAFTVSDYRTKLEKMSNGVAVPYVGIKVQDVTETMTSAGMPAGVYASECILDGPAYNAGIQNGDIVVRIGDKEIVSVKDYQTQVENLTVGRDVTIVVLRKGIDEYRELEYQVTVGAR